MANGIHAGRCTKGLELSIAVSEFAELDDRSVRSKLPPVKQLD